MTIVKEASPHLRKRASVNRMMIDVLIALLPVSIFAIVSAAENWWKIILMFAISATTMISAEFIYTIIRYKDSSKFCLSNVLSASVSGIIFAHILPISTFNHPYIIVVGALLGIVLGKLVFGGLGSNIFNPAAVGMVITRLSFGNYFTNIGDAYDATAGATLLTQISHDGILEFSVLGSTPYSVLDLFLGRVPGTIGEVSALCILIGFAYLLIRRSADFRPVVVYVGTFFALMCIVGLCVCSKLGFNNISYWNIVLSEMLGGGMLFGAAFMLTDPVTSPVNSPGRAIFGMIAAISTVFMRLFSALPEGVSFSILIANMFVPVIDYYKFSSKKFTWRKLVIMASMFVVSAAIIVIVLLNSEKIC